MTRLLYRTFCLLVVLTSAALVGLMGVDMIAGTDEWFFPVADVVFTFDFLILAVIAVDGVFVCGMFLMRWLAGRVE